MKRLLASILAAAVVCAIAWIFGFDFDKRGAEAGFLAVITIWCGGAVYLFPGWIE